MPQGWWCQASFIKGVPFWAFLPLSQIACFQGSSCFLGLLLWFFLLSSKVRHIPSPFPTFLSVSGIIYQWKEISDISLYQEVTLFKKKKKERKKNRNLKPTSCIRRPLNKKGHCFSADLQVLPSCWYCFCLQVGFPQVCTLATSNSWATHFLERGQHPTHQCK